MKKPEPTDEKTQEKWEGLAESLAAKGVELSAMFGMPALKFKGKAFGGLFGNAAVFKLEGEAHAKALKLDGAVLFDPSGMGRPMKAWVVIPYVHFKKWGELAHAGLESLSASLRPVAKKKK
jgi:hypothetical protein